MIYLVYVCMAILGFCAISLVILLTRTKDLGSRALLGDSVFYLMICIFIGACFWIKSSIGFDIPVLGALLGALSTIAMARILSKGRR
ncbi:MAG: cation:proton antiporter [Corynebacterium sp.]|nr:cation:proton antiporter [Corynebacterium sp.]